MTPAFSQPGGTYQLGDLTVSRMGYGAMQLAGPGVFGPPADRGEAVAVLREAVALGVTHIDTSDFYGPHVTNEIIREALHPYPGDLHIVTKVGARRDVFTPGGGGMSEPEPGSIEPQFTALAELRQQGLIRHLGLSTVNAEQ